MPVATLPPSVTLSRGDPMKLDWFVKSLLLVIAVLLGVVAFRPILQPAPVMAQDGSPYPFHIEQGIVSLRKSDGTTTWGKIAVDMRNGDVWGFPMQAQNTPYPVYGPSDSPKVSHPLYLGKMAFSEATR
jgi:hypothetical protein